jgi:hypothetical protein
MMQIGSVKSALFLLYAAVLLAQAAGFRPA